MAFKCLDCDQVFSQRKDMLKHMRNQHTSLVCGQCHRIFFSDSTLKKHIKQVHEKTAKEFKCIQCNKVFGRSNNLLQHQRICKQPSGSGIGQKRPSTTMMSRKPAAKNVKVDSTITKLRSAFNGAALSWRINFQDNDDVISQLKEGIFAMEGKLSDYQHERMALKFTMAVHVVFEQSSNPSIITEPDVCLVSEPFEVYSDTNIKNQLMNAYKQLLNYMDIFEKNGSGWVLSHLKALDTSVWQLDPLRASSHHSLPQWVINKRAVRNIQNKDNQCFKWAVLAALYQPTMPTKPCDVASYRIYETDRDAPDFKMLTFPVPLVDIKKFEKANNISVMFMVVQIIEVTM